MDTNIPWVAASVDELLAGAADHEVVDPDDGKSGSRFAKVVIDGEPCFVKSVSYESDWIMRVMHDHDQRTFLIWKAGIMHQAPECIDHTVIGMTLDGEGDSAVLTMLMHDVADHLVPEGHDVVPEAQHLGFIDALAQLSARFWGWDDPIGLCTLEERICAFAADNIVDELARVEPSPVLVVADEGWQRLPERAPALAALVAEHHRDPRVLADALRSTPQTFLHGDWKMGNLGMHPDGRTILLDWAYPGTGPACWDLAWYLSLNAARLPISKEQTVEAFRDALERHGVDTEGWWERQVDVSLLALAVMFGWEKAVGSDAELAWWEERAVVGAERL